MAIPKTVKYLLCYLPFILLGTGFVVFGVFQNGSARIALLIVGVVVLFSGLFAWCTDSDVGCLVVCSCWANKERKISKTKKSSKSSAHSNPTTNNAIFTIHQNRTTTASPQTTASKKTKKFSNTESNTVKEEEGKMIQRDRHNNYGQYSLQKQKAFDESPPNHPSRGGSRKPRFPTRAPSLDNYLNTYKPNGIHGRQEMRLTVRNLQKLDKIRQHHSSFDSDRTNDLHMYNSTNMVANDGFEVEVSIDIKKRESIKNWISDVHNSREDITNDTSPGWGVSKPNDSSKIQRKPLPAVPPRGHGSSVASGSAIDIEVHSLPRSYGSDGNKSPSGTVGTPEPPEAHQMHEYGFIVHRENDSPLPRPPRTILEAVIADQYV